MTNRTVFGPCPACGNWQLDVPDDEAPAVIEATIREHITGDRSGQWASYGLDDGDDADPWA